MPPFATRIFEYTLLALVGSALLLSTTAAGSTCDDWEKLRFNTPTQCNAVIDAGGGVWDVARDFELAPNQQNPNPGDGDENVWWFMYSEHLDRRIDDYERM